MYGAPWTSANGERINETALNVLIRAAVALNV